MVDYNALGNRIKKYRKEVKMTQANLAEKLDVSVSYISQIERGIAKISLPRLGEISECTKTPIQYFLADINIIDETYLKSEFTEKFYSMTPTQRKLTLEVMESIVKYEQNE